MHQPESLVFTALLQLVVVIAAARAGNQLFRRLGQPGVVGEIIAGLMLGPSLFGYFYPNISHALFAEATVPAMTVISQVGVVLLMFQIGADCDLGHLRRRRNRTGIVAISVVSTAVSWVMGFAIGRLSASVLAPHADPLVYSLFCGVVLTIVAVPVLGRILSEFDLTHTEVGVVAMSVAAINDVTGWVLLAAIAAYASAGYSPGTAAMQIAGILLLGIVARFALRPLVSWLSGKIPTARGEIPAGVLTAIVCFIFMMGMCTYLLGVFTIFGAFIAGLLFYDNKAFVELWRVQVGKAVIVLFLPVFFAYTGLRTNILGLVSGSDWLWVSIVLSAAILGKVVPVYLAGRACGFERGECAILGTLMNTRGLTELIALNIGYDHGFLSQRAFTIFVIMAVVTTLMTGPLLGVLLPRGGYLVARRLEA